MSSTILKTGLARDPAPGTASGPRLDHRPHAAGAVAFLLVLAAGLGYAAFSICTT